MSDDSEPLQTDQIALALAAMGASFAQVLCAAEPSLHRLLVDAATRNCRMLDTHGEALAADMLRTFVRALNDRDMFPILLDEASEQSGGDGVPGFAGPARARRR